MNSAGVINREPGEALQRQGGAGQQVLHSRGGLRRTGSCSSWGR